MGLTLG